MIKKCLTIALALCLAGIFSGFGKNESGPKAILKKVQYNEHHQSMVLCVPPGELNENAIGKPFILLIHGGAWTRGFGSWQDFRSHCKYLAGLGYPVANMSYRLAPRHPYPAATDDVKDAILWLHKHAPEYSTEKAKLNADRIILVGHSAGGHLSLLTALREKDLPIAGVVSLAGPTDLTTRKACKICDLHKKDFLRGTPPEELSPVNYARADAPPVYLFHGDRDHIVSITQSYAMAEALKEKGAAVKMKVMEGKRHWFPFTSEKNPVVVKDVMDFVLQGTLK